MTFVPRLRLTSAAVVLAFATGLLAFGLLARSPHPGRSAAAEAGGAPLAPGASTQARIAALQATVRATPTASGYAALGLAYIQRVRETGDPTFYPRAEQVLRAGLDRAPQDVQ